MAVVGPPVIATPKPVAVKPPVVTTEQRAQIVVDINAGYKQAGLNLYGFSTRDIADYLFGGGGSKVVLAEAEAIQRAALGLKQTAFTTEAGFLINPKALKSGPGDVGGLDIPWHIQHLAEHPKGSHYSGDFNSVVGNIGRGFAALFTLGLSEIPIGGDRLGKLTRIEPFISSNLSGGVFTTGSANKLEKDIFGYVFKAGTAVAGVSALTAGTSFSLSGAISPGTGATSIGVGPGSAASFASPAAPSEGLLSGFGGTLLSGGKYIGGALLTGFVGKFISGGQKALTNLLQGNVKEAGRNLIDAVVTGQDQPGSKPGPASGGYGGGGGGGYGGGGYATQSSSLVSRLLPAGLLLAILVLIAYFYKRRK